MSRDNWERLVSAVVKREQIRQLCHQDSITTVSSDFSQQILDSEDVSITPPPPISPKNSPVSEVSNNASGRRITRRLLSVLYRIRKPQDDRLVKVLSENLGIQLGQLRKFSLHELLLATENFSYKNLLENFGRYKVYKGWLTDGFPVTVKRYRDREAPAVSQFQKELETNSIVVHPNVVRVLGFCVTSEDLLIVYPQPIIGSVHSFMYLRDGNRSQPPLDWPIRKRIALGTARGLAYLHYDCVQKIIHRNIKPANIWLDDDFEAVIAGLNLTVYMDHNVTRVKTSVVGRIVHLPPEYLSSGTCSEKTDVFGYGIFLLELITGQKAFDLARLENDDDVMLLDWVKRNLKERKWEKIVDPDCEVNNMEEVVERLIKIALLCTQTAPDRRPKMSEISIMLEIGDLLTARWEKWCYNEEMNDLVFFFIDHF